MRSQNTPITLKSLLFTLSLVLSACGSDNPSNSASGGGAGGNGCENVSFVGQWQGVTVPADTLALNANCMGTSSYCQSTFSFTPIKSNGQVTLNIQTTNGNAFCGAVGTYNCAINATEPNLTLDCGTGAVNWTR